MPSVLSRIVPRSWCARQNASSSRAQRRQARPAGRTGRRRCSPREAVAGLPDLMRVSLAFVTQAGNYLHRYPFGGVYWIPSSSPRQPIAVDATGRLREHYQWQRQVQVMNERHVSFRPEREGRLAWWIGGGVVAVAIAATYFYYTHKAPDAPAAEPVATQPGITGPGGQCRGERPLSGSRTGIATGFARAGGKRRCGARCNG